MPSQGLNPGDRVVELAALVQSAAFITGGVATAWVMWLIKHSLLVSGGGFVAGVALGFVVAQLVARILYRGADRQTVVVQSGRRCVAGGYSCRPKRGPLDGCPRCAPGTGDLWPEGPSGFSHRGIAGVWRGAGSDHGVPGRGTVSAVTDNSACRTSQSSGRACARRSPRR